MTECSYPRIQQCCPSLRTQRTFFRSTEKVTTKESMGKEEESSWRVLECVVLREYRRSKGNSWGLCKRRGERRW